LPSQSSASGPPRALFAWTVKARASSGAGAIGLHLLEPQRAGLEAIAVVLWARTENPPDRVVARHRRAVFTVNDGRGANEQRGDHNGSFHATDDSTENNVLARQSRVEARRPEGCRRARPSPAAILRDGSPRRHGGRRRIHPCASAVAFVVAARWVVGSIRPTSCPRDYSPPQTSAGRPPPASNASADAVAGPQPTDANGNRSTHFCNSATSKSAHLPIEY